MSRYLLTPSLQDAWRFYQLIESKEKQDFLDTLLKKEITDPESLENIQRGIDFENDIRSACEGRILNTGGIDDDQSCARCIQEIANIVRGGLWQQRMQFEVKFFGMPFLIYGKMDVEKRDWIYDIKSTKKYEIGKYTESVQHPTYMFGSGQKKFAYLASDGEYVYREDYFLDNDMVNNMLARYEETVDGIMSDPDFRRAYMENWEAYKPKKVA